MIIVCHLFPFGCATKLIGLKMLFVRDCDLTTQRQGVISGISQKGWKTLA